MFCTCFNSLESIYGFVLNQPSCSIRRYQQWPNNSIHMKNLILTILFLTSLLTFAHKDKWDTHKENWSPLMLAIYNGQTENFTRLIKQNVDINYITPTKEGSEFRLTALDVAIRADNQKAIKILIETNKISRLNEGLFTAAGAQRASTIELLIKYGANPNYTNDFGHSVLMFATSFGSNEVVKCLVKNGANINHAKPNGMTALMLAGYDSNIEKLKLLLKLGAERNMRDSKGLRALDYFNKYCDIKKVSEINKTEIRALLK
ncbi:Ankyrin repeat protein [Flavobacterium daejeonense]|nr:Ankyrin repeat protein [Flavobacterium daejeonense]